MEINSALRLTHNRFGDNSLMRKTIIQPSTVEPPAQSEDAWLDLDSISTVEVTSEDPRFPIEGALSLRENTGWRAAQQGEQRIRILFDQPVALHRTQLRFLESQVERTQEFTLSALEQPTGPAKEIVRQQWNFSPSGSTQQNEDYRLNLPRVSVLELLIRPDVSGGAAVATLAAWRIA